MFKRITCLLLVVTMVFSMMPMRVLASQMEPAEVAAAEPASTTAATEEETTIPETTQAAEPETTTVCTEDAKESDAVIDSDFSELPDEDAPDETIVETVLRSEEEPADSEALFEGFLNKLFFGEDERSPQAILAGNRLARIDKYIYDALIPVIQQIARGQRSSTVVSVDLAGTGFLPEQANIPLLAEALTHDFPFEMYWYSGIYVSYSSNSSKMTLKLQVNAAYQASNYNAESPAINTTRAKTATQAVENARAIVNQYAGYSDYNKLTAYADKICALVKYDHYAADNDTYSTNINPWTLINVFDNDSTTNVVCNGYAEAFQYLCDLSDFDGDIVCYSPGGAEHRWNIVRIDGKSYLMDVTHCDDGNKATRNDKFMGGGSGSVEAGYRIGGFHYWYYDDVKETWGTGPNSILALSDKKYDPNSTPAPPPAGDTSQSELESALATCGGSYRLSKKVTLTSDMVLDGVNLTIASGGTLIVSAGTTLAVKKNASITLEKGSVLRINAAGVLLQSGKVKNNSGTFTKNGIICESADDYLLHLINECHKLSANEIRTKIGYLDKSLIASALTANQDDFIYKLSALEEAVGGAVAVEPGELFSDLKAEDFTVIGANLNMPKYTGAQMKVVIEKVAKQPDDHFFTCTMRLKNAENETELQIPVIVLMKNPSYKSGMNVKNIAVRHMNEDGTQVLSRINQGEYSWTFVLQNFGTIGFTLDNQGICGDNARWNYDNQTATLTVTGTGAMYDYDSEKPDWEGYLETVKSVVVQSGITHIGAHAFRGCKALLSVTMANSVTSLGVQIFTSCEKLRDVKLSENIKTLPRSTFSFCNSLIQITLPEKLEVLDNQVFWNSPRLTSIVIPRNVKSIGSLCFSGCTSLKSVTFVGNAPTFVKYDEYNNFEDVTATVYYPANNTTWSSSVMQNYGGNLTWVAGCTDGHTIVITKGQPATCTEPGISDGKTCSVCGAVIAIQTELAALGHDIISDREVPPTCTAPGHEAGSHCSRCDYTEGRNNIPALGHVEVTDAYVAPTCTQTGLTEGSHCSRCNAVLVKQTVLPAKGHSFEDAVCTVCGAAEVLEGSSYDGLTWNLDENGKLTISGTGDMYYTPWKTYADRIRSVEIQTGSTRIYRDAFSNCVNLTKVTMADTVAEIYSGAFEGSAALTTVTISKNVTEIGASAYEGCASLTSITIPQGVATIEYYTFKDCTSLQAINIPGSVKEIGWNAFEGCTALRSVSLSQGLEIMESGVFEGCTSLSSIEIPKTVQEIGGSAFNGCTNLWSVNIPSGIEIIEYSTFEGCSKLSRITIPATVKEIGSHAFRDCTSLTSVTVPQGVTTLGAGVFRGCSALYSVSLPKSLESVSYDLFAYCTSLYDVNIPSGLTELSDFMFNSCESLTQITIPNTVTTIGRAAFAGCLGLKEITLPASVATLGSRAFTNCNNLKSIKVSSANEFFSADAYGVVYNKDKTVLVLIPGGLAGSYTIPEGVVIVGKDAVCNGKKLTGITFPSTLTAIEEYALSNCSALTDAWFKGNAPVIAEFAFEDTTLTARYPVGDTSWTAEKLQNYGGSITWVASCINGHAEVLQPGVPATCTEEGISEGKYCSVCGDVIARQEVIPALGHAEVIEGYVAPTCTETGHTEGRHCERCGEIFAAAEEIPALGHKEVADAYVAPTCTKIGLTEGSHCDRCGEVFVEQERIPALGHDFLEGTCLRCGAPDEREVTQ